MVKKHMKVHTFTSEFLYLSVLSPIAPRDLVFPTHSCPFYFPFPIPAAPRHASYFPKFWLQLTP